MRSKVLVAASLALVFCVLAVRSAGAGDEQHEYVGNKKCKMCHLKEWKSWAETKMAKAFEPLKPGENAEAKKAANLDPEKDYTKDPESVNRGFNSIWAHNAAAGRCRCTSENSAWRCLEESICRAGTTASACVLSRR